MTDPRSNGNLASIQALATLTKTDYGIGSVGLGGVAAWGNLPAYRKYGFRVVAGAAPREEARDAARDRFGIAKIYGTYQELLADPSELNCRWTW